MSKNVVTEAEEIKVIRNDYSLPAQKRADREQKSAFPASPNLVPRREKKGRKS